MIGIDCRLTKLDLLLEHKRVIAVHVKYGQLERCCLGVGSSASQYGTFLVVADQHTSSLVKGDVEITIMSRSASLLGSGRMDSCELTTDSVSQAISDPTFQYIMGGNATMEIIHKTSGKPDIVLGTAYLSICVYQLMLRKGCRCEQSAQEAFKSSLVPEALPDTDFLEMSIDEGTEAEHCGSDSDSSLDNFLARFNSKTVQQQTTPTKHKHSSATQTQFPNVRTSFAKKTQSVSREFNEADVVAVMAPTNLAYLAPSEQQRATSSSGKPGRQGQAVNNYAFIDAPPPRVTLHARQRVNPVSSTSAGAHAIVAAGRDGTRSGSRPKSAPTNSRASGKQKPSSSAASSKNRKVEHVSRKANVEVRVKEQATEQASTHKARDSAAPLRARSSAHVTSNGAWY